MAFNVQSLDVAPSRCLNQCGSHSCVANEKLAMAVSLRGELGASLRRGLVKNARDGLQVRRLLALSAIYCLRDAQR